MYIYIYIVTFGFQPYSAYLSGERRHKVVVRQAGRAEVHHRDPREGGLGCSGMWCFGLWGLNIIVLHPLTHIRFN